MKSSNLDKYIEKLLKDQLLLESEAKEVCNIVKDILSKE